MTDRYCQILPTRSFHIEVEAEQGTGKTFPMGGHQKTWTETLQEEHESHLRVLRQFIAELLIKNQKLRDLLEADNTREEFIDEPNRSI